MFLRTTRKCGTSCILLLMQGIGLMSCYSVNYSLAYLSQTTLWKGLSAWWRLWRPIDALASSPVLLMTWWRLMLKGQLQKASPLMMLYSSGGQTEWEDLIREPEKTLTWDPPTMQSPKAVTLSQKSLHLMTGTDCFRIENSQPHGYSNYNFIKGKKFYVKIIARRDGSVMPKSVLPKSGSPRTFLAAKIGPPEPFRV